MRRPRDPIHGERERVRLFSDRRGRHDGGMGLAQHPWRLFLGQEKLKS